MSESIRTYTYMRVSGTWVDVSRFVVGDIGGEVGMYDDNPANRIAPNGHINLFLDNEDGRFSDMPIGTGIWLVSHWRAYTRNVFVGNTLPSRVDVGTWGDQYVKVDAVDFNSAKIILSDMELKTDRTATQAMEDVLAFHFGAVPVNNIDFDQDTDNLPTVFDNPSTQPTLFSEMNAITMSELGYTYLIDGGFKIRFESRKARNGLRQPLFANYSLVSEESGFLKLQDGGYLLKQDGGKLLLNLATHHEFNANFALGYRDLEVYNGKEILNRVSFTIYPRYMATGTTSLYVFDTTLGNTAIPINYGQTFELRGRFSLQQASADFIAGKDIVTPVITTDYLFNATSSGTGADLSANLTISFTSTPSGFISQITNTGANGYLTKHNVRGKAILRNNPIDIVWTDTTSQATYGHEPISMSLPYAQDVQEMETEVLKILNFHRFAKTDVLSASFETSSINSAIGFMFMEEGDMLSLTCNKPVIDNLFYINGTKFVIHPGGGIEYTRFLADIWTFTKGLVPVAIDMRNNVDTDNALLLTYDSIYDNLDAYTLSTWVWLRDDAFSKVMSKNDKWSIQVTAATRRIFFLHRRVTTDGGWRTPNNSLPTGTWAHIAVAYDASSVDNDPNIYINGVAQSLFQYSDPAGASEDDSRSRISLGNLYKEASGADDAHFFSLLKDARIYNRVLTAAEVAEIAAGENDYTTVQDSSLIFHGFGIRTFLTGTYMNQPMLTDRKGLDNIYGGQVTAVYDASNSGTFPHMLDPTQTSYPN